MSSKSIDITGKTFSDLYVIKQVENKGKFAAWECFCLKCKKNYRIATGVALRNGTAKNCGLSGCRGVGGNLIHGYKNTPLYAVWSGIKTRCNDLTDEYYGGKGISYCDDWEDFIPFRDWALANGYKEGLQIDRINNDGDYEPSNCRFVERRVNQNNRKKTLKITAWGETKAISYWVEDSRCKVSKSQLVIRLNSGMKPEEAMSIPASKTVSRKITAWGETKLASEWVLDPRCKVSKKRLLARINRDGMSPENAISIPPRN